MERNQFRMLCGLQTRSIMQTHARVALMQKSHSYIIGPILLVRFKRNCKKNLLHASGSLFEATRHDMITPCTYGHADAHLVLLTLHNLAKRDVTMAAQLAGTAVVVGSLMGMSAAESKVPDSSGTSGALDILHAYGSQGEDNTQSGGNGKGPGGSRFFFDGHGQEDPNSREQTFWESLKLILRQLLQHLPFALAFILTSPPMIWIPSLIQIVVIMHLICLNTLKSRGFLLVPGFSKQHHSELSPSQTPHEVNFCGLYPFLFQASFLRASKGCFSSISQSAAIINSSNIAIYRMKICASAESEMLRPMHSVSQAGNRSLRKRLMHETDMPGQMSAFLQNASYRNCDKVAKGKVILSKMHKQGRLLMEKLSQCINVRNLRNKLGALALRINKLIHLKIRFLHQRTRSNPHPHDIIHGSLCKLSSMQKSVHALLTELQESLTEMRPEGIASLKAAALEAQNVKQLADRVHAELSGSAHMPLSLLENKQSSEWKSNQRSVLPSEQASSSAKSTAFHFVGQCNPDCPADSTIAALYPVCCTLEEAISVNVCEGPELPRGAEARPDSPTKGRVKRDVTACLIANEDYIKHHGEAHNTTCILPTEQNELLRAASHKEACQVDLDCITEDAVGGPGRLACAVVRVPTEQTDLPSTVIHSEACQVEVDTIVEDPIHEPNVSVDLSTLLASSAVDSELKKGQLDNMAGDLQEFNVAVSSSAEYSMLDTRALCNMANQMTLDLGWRTLEEPRRAVSLLQEEMVWTSAVASHGACTVQSDSIVQAAPPVFEQTMPANTAACNGASRVQSDVMVQARFLAPEQTVLVSNVACSGVCGDQSDALIQTGLPVLEHSEHAASTRLSAMPSLSPGPHMRSVAAVDEVPAVTTISNSCTSSANDSVEREVFLLANAKNSILPKDPSSQVSELEAQLFSLSSRHRDSLSRVRAILDVVEAHAKEEERAMLAQSTTVTVQQAETQARPQAYEMELQCPMQLVAAGERSQGLKRRRIPDQLVRTAESADGKMLAEGLAVCSSSQAQSHANKQSTGEDHAFMSKVLELDSSAYTSSSISAGCHVAALSVSSIDGLQPCSNGSPTEDEMPELSSTSGCRSTEPQALGFNRAQTGQLCYLKPGHSLGPESAVTTSLAPASVVESPIVPRVPSAQAQASRSISILRSLAPDVVTQTSKAPAAASDIAGKPSGFSSQDVEPLLTNCLPVTSHSSSQASNLTESFDQISFNNSSLFPMSLPLQEPAVPCTSAKAVELCAVCEGLPFISSQDHDLILLKDQVADLQGLLAKAEDARKLAMQREDKIVRVFQTQIKSLQSELQRLQSHTDQENAALIATWRDLQAAMAKVEVLQQREAELEQMLQDAETELASVTATAEASQSQLGSWMKEAADYRVAHRQARRELDHTQKELVVLRGQLVSAHATEAALKLHVEARIADSARLASHHRSIQQQASSELETARAALAQEVQKNTDLRALTSQRVQNALRDDKERREVVSAVVAAIFSNVLAANGVTSRRDVISAYRMQNEQLMDELAELKTQLDLQKRALDQRQDQVCDLQATLDRQSAMQVETQPLPSTCSTLRQSYSTPPYAVSLSGRRFSCPPKPPQTPNSPRNLQSWAGSLQSDLEQEPTLITPLMGEEAECGLLESPSSLPVKDRIRRFSSMNGRESSSTPFPEPQSAVLPTCGTRHSSVSVHPSAALKKPRLVKHSSARFSVTRSFDFDMRASETSCLAGVEPVLQAATKGQFTDALAGSAIHVEAAESVGFAMGATERDIGTEAARKANINANADGRVEVCTEVTEMVVLKAGSMERVCIRAEAAVNVDTSTQADCDLEFPMLLRTVSRLSGDNLEVQPEARKASQMCSVKGSAESSLDLQQETGWARTLTALIRGGQVRLESSSASSENCSTSSRNGSVYCQRSEDSDVCTVQVDDSRRGRKPVCELSAVPQCETGGGVAAMTLQDADYEVLLGVPPLSNHKLVRAGSLYERLKGTRTPALEELGSAATRLSIEALALEARHSSVYSVERSAHTWQCGDPEVHERPFRTSHGGTSTKAVNSGSSKIRKDARRSRGLLLQYFLSRGRIPASRMLPLQRSLSSTGGHEQEDAAHSQSSRLLVHRSTSPISRLDSDASSVLYPVLEHSQSMPIWTLSPKDRKKSRLRSLGKGIGNMLGLRTPSKKGMADCNLASIDSQ